MSQCKYWEQGFVEVAVVVFCRLAISVALVLAVAVQAVKGGINNNDNDGY